MIFSFPIIQLMAKSLCTDKFPMMKKLNFPKMINCWSNFPQLHFLGGCVCWPGLSCQFPHNSTSWPRTPVPFLPIFDQNYFILAKAKIFMTLRQPFTVFRVLEWTFSKVLARSGWSKGNSKCLNSKDWKRWWGKRQVTNICLKKEFKIFFLASDVCF